MLLKFIFPVSTLGQFKTYCSDTETNTKNFLPFGSLDWQNPNTENTIDTAWNTTRDVNIVEEDDGYKQVYLGRSRYFGSTATRYSCLSSNGPLYFSPCPTTADWSPKNFDQSWAGVSAIWEDLRPDGTNPGAGGNVYFRRVNAATTTDENFRDIRQAQALFNTEDPVSQLYVATYHKMAHSNPKRECDAGATWQYVFTFPVNANNPLIAVNYGQLDWSLSTGVKGVNGLATAENSYFDFNDLDLGWSKKMKLKTKIVNYLS